MSTRPYPLPYQVGSDRACLILSVRCLGPTVLVLMKLVMVSMRYMALGCVCLLYMCIENVTASAIRHSLLV
jgi:hypothetical protein